MRRFVLRSRRNASTILPPPRRRDYSRTLLRNFKMIWAKVKITDKAEA